MHYTAINWLALLYFLAAHEGRIQASTVAISGRPIAADGRITLKSADKPLPYGDNDGRFERDGQRRRPKTLRHQLRHSNRSAISFQGNASALFKTDSISNAGADHPEIVAIAATAAIAAASNRAVATGRQLLHDLSGGSNKILQPEVTADTHDVLGEAGRAALSSAAVDPEFAQAAVDTAEANAISASAPRKISDSKLHSAGHNAWKKGSSIPGESDSSWETDELENVTPAKMDDVDSESWPATDLIPAPRGDNATAVTPVPMTWQTSGPPPLPILLLPVLSFLLGLTCLCLLFLADDTEDGEPMFNRRSRAPTFYSKTDAVFNAIDQDRDGFVSLSELRSLARLTNPKSARQVTMDWFRDLCRPLGADPQRGLDRQEFRQTYVLLGNDVDRDFAAVSSAAEPPRSSGSNTGAAASVLESARENA